MKELSQIRMAVLDALRGAGIQAMEVFPEKQAMAYSGVVAAVGVGAASGKTAGFCHYLPCHLEVEFYFRYLTWAECEAAEYTWDEVETAQHTWESFQLAVPPEE